MCSGSSNAISAKVMVESNEAFYSAVENFNIAVDLAYNTSIEHPTPSVDAANFASHERAHLRYAVHFV